MMTGCLREWKTEPLPLGHKARNLLRTFPPHIPTPLVQDTGLKQSLERAGRAQRKAGGVWRVCVRVGRRAAHRLTRLSSSSTHKPQPHQVPRRAGVCTSTRVLRVCPHGTVKHEVHLASCLQH